MRWQCLEPLQSVGALLATGADAPRRLAAAMAAKPALLRALPVAHGPGWAAVFASSTDEPDAETEGLLPHLPGMTALYQIATGLWLPVGVAPAVPDHAKPALLAALLDRHRIAPPVILVPRRPGGEDGEADAYVVGETVAFDRSPLGRDAVGRAA